MIVICEIDNKLLVGFPSQIWHRAVSRRSIAPKCFSKPLHVSVSAVFSQDRGAPLDEDINLNVWVGFLSPDAEHLIEFGAEGDADIVFGWTVMRFHHSTGSRFRTGGQRAFCFFVQQSHK